MCPGKSNVASRELDYRRVKLDIRTPAVVETSIAELLGTAIFLA